MTYMHKEDQETLRKIRAEYYRAHIEPLLERGLGVRGLCSELEKKGIRGMRGAPFTPTTLKPILKTLELKTIGQKLKEAREEIFDLED